MSGHSKWSTIKRKKGALDQKRGKIFSKLAKEITVAAKLGGGDPIANARLRTVLLAAKAENLPKDNIERAIKKGTGELPGVVYEEARYECYGPSGVGIIVDVLTDNKRRTVPEIRNIVTKLGGSMAENGAVSWNFEQKGTIAVNKEGIGPDDMFEKAIEAGAEDVDTEGERYEITTAAADLHHVSGALEAMKLKIEEAKLVMQPKTTVDVDGKTVATVLRLMEALEDHDDVQEVYTNVNISEEAMEAAMAD
ncbi:MAG: YebC/PmpR family DNA-binding transcriptional regulator [Candidatus Hydrogenedentes bacterium]|nr:YebC/PmpR family DNA-binding transcriptional regulator [Candidatus Hydrogenedentota bacterium]